MREIRVGDIDKRISSFLTSLRRGCPECLDLLVVDWEGRVVASSNPSLIGRPPRAAPDQTPARGAIEGPVDSPDHHRPSLRFSVPIPDPDAPARSLGWLVALVDWERETEIVSRVRESLVSVGIDTDVLVLDADGVVIGGAPRRDGQWRRGDTVRFAARRAGDGVPAQRGDAAPATQGEGAPAAQGAAVAAPQIELAAGVIVGEGGLPSDLPPWRILVAQPLSEAFAPVRRMARVLAAALGGTLLVALAVALGAARRVTRPLAELTAAAREVGRGHRLVPPLPVRSGDELGTLAAAFNRMATDLGHAEERLVEAAKFAFVGELAAGVAHEVRTPLGVLRSSAQLLERSLDTTDEDARELLQLVRDEVDRIERVVSGLLELGRPRELRLERAPLGQIVFRAADFVAAQAQAKRITIARRPVAPDPLAFCDPELIYQVALNLLVNAVQILAPGSAIEVALLPPRDGHAGFEVRDDGPGIPEDARERIFQPFFSRREGGTGLGLTFVQHVVLEHRGQISVTDGEDRGTIFRVELPAAEVEA